MKDSIFSGSGAWRSSESMCIVSATVSAVSPQPFSKPRSLILGKQTMKSISATYPFQSSSTLVICLMYLATPERSEEIEGWPRLEVLIRRLFWERRYKCFSCYQCRLKLCDRVQVLVDHKILPREDMMSTAYSRSTTDTSLSNSAKIGCWAIWMLNSLLFPPVLDGQGRVRIQPRASRSC